MTRSIASYRQPPPAILEGNSRQPKIKTGARPSPVLPNTPASHVKRHTLDDPTPIPPVVLADREQAPPKSGGGVALPRDERGLFADLAEEVVVVAEKRDQVN